MLLAVLAGIGLIITVGFVCLFVRDGKACLRLGAAGMIAGSMPGIVAAADVLRTGAACSLKIPWQVPYGSFNVELDSLSGLFLIVILAVCSVAAVYGCGYLAASTKARLGASVFFFNMLAASMAMVVIARNGMLFLMAWEIMALASYFLVTFDDHEESVRRAGWIYFVACHMSTAFLLVFFILMQRSCQTMDFDRMGLLAGLPPAAKTALFLLALVGFGTKAGIMPLHVWLPEAHPAAPSHVSAVMSGVMIKTGIYGIVRALMWLPQPPQWWGWLLIGLGALSGVLGVLFALAQHDIKRLLAYHSVENIGIILLGVGVGTLGLSRGSTVLAIVGFGGGLLHVVNHALFKGLLFLGAGAVVHAAGSRCIDVLGGLGRRMPQTAVAFLIGAVAICGLPPLNGFVSEFMIYYGALVGVADGRMGIVIPAVLVAAALSLIGGLALACFTKAFGFIFLGEPRTDDAAGAHEAGFAMRASAWALAAGCTVIGLLAPVVVRALTHVLADVTQITPTLTAQQVHTLDRPLLCMVAASAALAVCVLFLAYARHRLLSSEGCSRQVTWDCGYIRPTPRMQYTASSFAQPIVGLFAGLLRTHYKQARPRGFFPAEASYSSHTPDPGQEYLFRPLFCGFARLVSRLRWLQYGVVQVYVLYIALMLIILLIWKL